nr:ice-binding family protein [Actinomycetota bacterium]
VYDSASGTFEITGALTLDAQGDPDAVFIFQTDSTLITASASRVVLINGAQACNVFWQIGSSATLGTNSSFAGNILALTSITATTGATVDGRLLARNGAVTLDSNTITASQCAVAVPVPEPTPEPEPTPVPVPGDEDGPTDGGGGGTSGADTTITAGGGDTGSDAITGGGDGTTGTGSNGTPGGGTPGTTGNNGTPGGGTTTVTTGGGTTTAVTTGGGEATTTTTTTDGGDTTTRGGGGDTGGPNSPNDRSRDPSEGTLPFTGLGVVIPALAGIVMLLLGAALRTRAPGRTSSTSEA